MSQYPYGYGQYPGYNPQQQYTHPQYNGYPAPTYTPQPDPSAVDAHYAASQASFNYNATSIPGLGIVGTPTGAPSYPGLNSGSWNQQSSAIGGPTASAYPFPPNPAPIAPASQAYSPAHPQTFPPPSTAPAAAGQPETDPDKAYEPENEESAEEGEVSEDEFDDIYEPRDAAAGRNNVRAPQQENSSKTTESRDESMIDPQDTNFYETEVEDTAAVQNGASKSAAARERSGSYSPYLSPREIHHDISASDDSASNSSAHPRTKLVSNKSNAPTGSSDILSPGVPQLQQPASTAQKQVQNGTTRPTTPSFASVAEAKKEAQKAILRLLPHGVKYQTYLDEGFDEKVVKALFTELNLIPASSSPVVQMSSTQAEKESGPSNKTQSPATAGTSKTEERKDRIARLLAQKAAKPSTPGEPAPSTAKTAASSKPAAVAAARPSTATPNKSKIDKDLILKQKLEALRKTQKSQALKAGGGKDAIPAPSSETTSRPQTGTPQPFTISGQSRQQSPLHPPQIPALPGLLTSANQIQPGNQRKRPVASDFVDYPSTKRPFAQNRQESSLVIDISDESDDDDDDIEMEVDSPEDGPSTGAIFPVSSVPRGPSIRDFPPLSNLPNRQYASPAPSSQTHTPPYTLNGKPAESEYLRKMKEIAEIKRQIAEKEAKKSAKPGSLGPQTPNGGSRTPPELRALEVSESNLREALSSGIVDASDGPSAQLMSEAQSIKIPKRAELASTSQESIRERRERISSVQLPRVEAGLAEKNAKMKLLRDAEARLQAEISEAMAEQRRLNEEMEQLAMETSPSPPRHSGMESEVSSAEREVQPSGQESPTGPSGDLKDVNETNLVMSGALLPGTSVGATPVEISEEVSTHPEPAISSLAEAQPMNQEALDDSHITKDTGDAPATAQENLTTSTSLDSEPEAGDIPMDLGSVDEPIDVIPAISTEDTNMTNTIANDDGQTVENSTDVHEPLEANLQDAADQIPLDSPPFSPAPADANIDIAQDAPQDPKVLETPEILPDQISSVDVQANDAALEEHAETADAPREEVEDNTPEVRTSFVPYESPLHYFHAYRFHPNYSKSVPGGLKSLTYSNKIDPKKEVCPYELDGQGCPKGDRCEFQHFEKMPAPDDQILLELGQSDEYTGEEKTRFMAGLRQLLTEFRAAKVKDFPSIAQGIVDYRRRFLNDPSKVLRLEGVHI